ncbi:hypothetical protein ABW19_dt0206880 [Dactylella cylindrospora]|nr:hypothetical protein ABW19_dt0206880 [Dactylella cylindrospora]
MRTNKAGTKKWHGAASGEPFFSFQCSISLFILEILLFRIREMNSTFEELAAGLTMKLLLFVRLPSRAKTKKNLVTPEFSEKILRGYFLEYDKEKWYRCTSYMIGVCTCTYLHDGDAG